MKTIILEVQVQDGEVVVLNQKLQETEQSFKEVQKTADKATDTTTKGIKKSSLAVEELDKRTGGAASKLIDLSKKAKTAGISMRTAFIATGIGAFVVAMGVVVAYWDEIVELMTGANAQLKRNIELSKTKLTDLENEFKILESQEKLYKLQGKSVKEITEAKKKNIEAQILQNQALLKGLQDQVLIEESVKRELSLRQKLEIAALSATNQTAAAGAKYKEYLFGSEEERAALAQTKQDIADAIEKNNLLQALLFKLNNPENTGTTGEGEKESRIGKGLTQGEDTTIQDLRDKLQTLADIDNEFLEEEFYRQEGARLRGIQRDKEAAEERIRIAELEADAKLAAQAQFASHLGNILGAISQLFGEATAASKLAALAEIAIGTGVGFIQALDIAQKSAKGTGPAAAFAFPIFYASQVAAVLGAAAQAKNILKTVKGGGGGFSSPGIGLGGGSGGGAPQLDFNVVGNTGINQLGNLIGDELGKERRSYVVWQDIKKNQKVEDNSVFESQV